MCRKNTILGSELRTRVEAVVTIKRNGTAKHIVIARKHSGAVESTIARELQVTLIASILSNCEISSTNEISSTG